ncbi:MAG: CehA/McbA family metallohydrolase [Candidatus Poribacteria bacterium]
MALLKVQIREFDKSRITPARVQIWDEKNKYYYPDSCISYEKDNHFITNGNFEYQMPTGRFFIRIEKGKEYVPVESELFIKKRLEHHVDCELQRWINMAELGWYSGDLHIHRTISEMENLILAEDLNIAPNITVWNNWKYSNDDVKLVPKDRIVRIDKTHFFSILTQEDERQGGAVLLLNLDSPIELGLTSNWHPAGFEYCRIAHENGFLVDQEKPFWWETPVNVALGVIDTIGIINNHIQRQGIMDNEAWGKPRNRDQYPDYNGFVNNILDLYYHYLNLGLRIPISAGSASGVLNNPVGFNRLYVHIEEDLNYKNWFLGMKAGRSFATNGPMLFFSIDEHESGDFISSPNGEALHSKISIETESVNPLDNVQIIYNNEIIKEFSANGLNKFSQEFDAIFNESGWIIARVFEKLDKTVRFAHTSPIYIQVGQPMSPRKDSALFYANWCKELLAISKADKDRYITNVHREEVESLYRHAIAFYENLIR